MAKELMDQGRVSHRIERSDLKFAVAHFTLFSATERERLHGHNYYVGLTLRGKANEAGLFSDYTLFREAMLELCQELNEHMLLPAKSPFLRIETCGDVYKVYFHKDVMQFLVKDTLVLPLKNISNEELCRFMLNRLLVEISEEERMCLESMTVSVSSALGQQTELTWSGASG
jgi:6-pyruvoyltetrahydropterin/6-carboxytetrahydropterin synthase